MIEETRKELREKVKDKIQTVIRVEIEQAKRPDPVKEEKDDYEFDYVQM